MAGMLDVLFIPQLNRYLVYTTDEMQPLALLEEKGIVAKIKQLEKNELQRRRARAAKGG